MRRFSSGEKSFAVFLGGKGIFFFPGLHIEMFDNGHSRRRSRIYLGDLSWIEMKRKWSALHKKFVELQHL